MCSGSRHTRSRAVDPTAHRIVTWAWNNPPSRGDHVLVNGVRCRVTRSRYRRTAPGQYLLLLLKVKPAPQRTS